MQPKHFQLLTFGRISLIGPAGEDADLARRRRKVALLALLAVSRRPPSRASLMEMFWGNLDEDRARHSLSDALSHLRKVLGRESIAIRSEVVELDTGGRLAVDAIEFEAACETRDHARAIALYGGPFLGDFHVEKSESFEDWVSRQRSRYARMFVQACESHSAALLKRSEFAECVAVATRWLEVDALSAAPASALLEAARSSDDVDLARHALDEYERWKARRMRDAGIPADARLEGLATEAASRLASRMLRRTPHAFPAVASETEAPALVDDTPARPLPDRPRALAARWVPVGLATLAAAALLGLFVSQRASAHETPLKPVVALVDFRAEHADTSLSWLGDGLRQMIAADLARVPLADVIPLVSVRGASVRAGHGDSLSTADAIDVAKSVHATLAVSARVSRNEGSYVVTVTMRSVDDPRQAQEYTATGHDVFQVADQVAAHILSVVGVGTSGPRLSDVETSNTEAFRHFTDGQRYLDDGRDAEANREFDLAIAADSTFTSAIVARMHSGSAGYQRVKPLFDRVRSRMTEWDRMSEEVYDTFREGEHARAEVLGQQLEARFPRDPRAIDLLANIYFSHGRFREAEQAFQRLLALDSLALVAGHGPCAPCGALEGLSNVRRARGDTAGARRAVLRLTELQPGSPAAWTNYGNVLALSGMTDQAIVAFRRARTLLGDSAFDIFTARALTAAHRFEDAEALARPSLATKDAGEARDLLSTILRERGEFRASNVLLAIAAQTEPGLQLVYGHALGALGDTAGVRRTFTGRFFDPRKISAGGAVVGALRGDEARAFAWDHTLEADAIWERADTTWMRATADSIELIGSRSYYARDWQLYHHIRGLIDVRAGKLDDAERELVAGMALFPGWTRTNLMLARVRIARAAPAGAVETLRRAYLEPLDAMGRYATRTELDFEMARAFAALSQRDSARVYAANVRRAWAHADPELRQRLVQLP